MKTAGLPAFGTAALRRAVQGTFDVDQVRKGIRPVGGAAGESMQYLLGTRRRNAKDGSAPNTTVTKYRAAAESGRAVQRAIHIDQAANGVAPSEPPVKL